MLLTCKSPELLLKEVNPLQSSSAIPSSLLYIRMWSQDRLFQKYTLGLSRLRYRRLKFTSIPKKLNGIRVSYLTQTTTSIVQPCLYPQNLKQGVISKLLVGNSVWLSCLPVYDCLGDYYLSPAEDIPSILLINWLVNFRTCACTLTQFSILK